MDLENTIIDGLSSLATSEDEKFFSFQHHLGVPAMHPKLEDGKSAPQTPVRIQ